MLKTTEISNAVVQIRDKDCMQEELEIFFEIKDIIDVKINYSNVGF